MCDYARLKFIIDKIKKPYFEFVEKSLNDGKLRFQKAVLKEKINKFIAEKMSSIKQSLKIKVLQLKSKDEFIELETDKNLIQCINGQLRTDVCKFIKDYFENKYDVNYCFDDFIRKQMYKIFENDIVEDIKNDIERYSCDLIESELKKKTYKYLKVGTKKNLKYHEESFVEK